MLDRSVPPAIKPFGRLTLPPERVYECTNGARLHVVSDSLCPLVRLCVVAAGGKDDIRMQTTAILASQMMSEGSARFGTAQVADMLDFHGASLHGRATDHHTRLDLTAPPAHIIKLLPIIADAINNPSIPQKRLELCRTQQAARCEYNLNRVDNIAYKSALKLIAGNCHPHVRFPKPDDFTNTDRNTLLGYLSDIWHAEGVDVFLSGDISCEIESETIKFIESLPIGPAFGVYITPFSPEPAQTLRVQHDGAEQCAVQAMIPSVGRNHEDYIPLRLAVAALGGFFGSRLMQNIREDKGYTYGITASLNGTPEGGFVEISAECATEYTDRLIDELRKELKEMCTRPLSGDELLRLRLFEQTRLAAVLDNAISTADYYLTALTVNMPDNYYAMQEEITAAITPDRITNVSERYLRPELIRSVIVGDFKS